MRGNKKLFVILFLVSFPVRFYTQNGGVMFSREEVLNDLDTLRNMLEEGHYNLYAYTARNEFEGNYNSIKSAIKEDSISLKKAVGLFQKVISKANTGHAEIDFPAISYIDFVQEGGKLFPLEVALENGKAYIRKSYASHPDITEGSEILKINSRTIPQILAEMYPYISAERNYLKNAKIEFWTFPRLLWQVYGEQDSYSVTLKENNELRDYNLKSVPGLEGYEYKRKDILISEPNLEFHKESAYLNPGSFSGDEEVFKKFIDSAFTMINNRRLDKLIIDLRNNSGGNDSFSDYLTSYIADEPFKWSSRFSIRSSDYLKQNIRQNNDTLNPYFQAILKRNNGETFDYEFKKVEPQTSDKRFKGEIFTLINRQTYSQAAVTAALMQEYGFATLVGEESGDFPSLYASIFTLQLPNTGVGVKIPKGYLVSVNKTENQGVIPDIQIKDHLLDEKDEILEELLQRLDKNMVKINKP